MEKDPYLAEIEMKAREDAERQNRLNGIKESKEQSKNREKALNKMLKKDLVDLINNAWPDLEEHAMEKLSWKNMPFIPEDLGFKEHTVNSEDRGIVRVYFRTGLVITKLPSEDLDYEDKVKEKMTINGKWRFKTTEGEKVTGTMEFEIPSKFAAYQLLKTLGYEYDRSESTVPETEIDIDKVLAQEEEK